jgi:hypothetical protein
MKDNIALNKVVDMLNSKTSDESLVNFSFDDKPFGLVAGLFIPNPLDPKSPFGIPVSRVEGKEIIAFAPVNVTILDDYDELDIVCIVPSQGTQDDITSSVFSKLKVKFVRFANYTMPDFEAGTPRRFAHFEIVGGYNSEELDALKHAVLLRTEANDKLPGKMTFEV